jgi:protein-disulfide isomerase
VTLGAWHRRGLIAGALALVVGPVLAAAPPAEDGMVMGNPKAPVTVVEYASVGCPHCAAWAREVFPAFKARFVDTGKVRFVLREMLTGNVALAQAGFLTARCAGPDKYFQVVEAVYRGQGDVARQGAAYGVLLAIARNAGLTQERFDACLGDEAATAALQARSDRAAAGGVKSTPAFFVNGVPLGSDPDIDTLAAAIAKAGPARRKRR